MASARNIARARLVFEQGMDALLQSIDTAASGLTGRQM
jgi:hypothetical protein